MINFYEFLDQNNYFWDRLNSNVVYVCLTGYKVFDDRYNALMSAARACNAIKIEEKFDPISGKTFYCFKHK